MAVEIYAPARELESGVIVPTYTRTAPDELKRLFRREALPPEVLARFREFGRITWHSIDKMTYPETGLPADHLHFDHPNGNGAESLQRIDKTSMTNIGFMLATIGAAADLGFISQNNATSRLDQLISTIERFLQDPEIAIHTRNGKVLPVNWIQPSSGKVLRRWPGTENPVKQHVSSVDVAWLMAFSKLIAAQFPEFSIRMQEYLSKIDLEFMFDEWSGFFHGSYLPEKGCFETWQYNALSEARIAYAVCGEEIAGHMVKLFNRRSEASYFYDQEGNLGRKTWNGELFALFWPLLLIAEDEYPHWLSTFHATINAQKEYGWRNNNGYYGYSAGLGPDNRYFEFRVPETGENPSYYENQTVITPAALISTGIVQPRQALQELSRLCRDFPDILHPGLGLGDTLDTKSGAIQKDQLLPNQASILLACWNIVNDRQPQKLFEQQLPISLLRAYEDTPLW